jgi:hypothetical protein
MGARGWVDGGYEGGGGVRERIRKISGTFYVLRLFLRSNKTDRHSTTPGMHVSILALSFFVVLMRRCTCAFSSL